MVIGRPEVASQILHFSINQTSMKNWISIFFLLNVASSWLLAQNQPMLDVRGEDARPHSEAPVNNSPENIQFLIVSDRTGGHRPGVFKKAIEKANLLQPEFIMSVGDLIEGYTTDKTEIETQWEAFDSLVAGADMRFYYLAGNHDYSNQTMGDVWKHRLGPDYYHFRYKDALFLALNSEDQFHGTGKPFLSEEQFNYFKRVLLENEDVRWTFVFMHQPMWMHENTGEWPNLMALLEPRSHTVFAGHVHQYTHYDRNNSDYIVLGTTGGTSKLRGTAYGEIDHLTWVTLTDRGPVMSNLLLDGVERIDFATERSVKIFNEIARNPPVYIKPVFTKDSLDVPFIELVLNNEQEYPMEVGIQFYSNPNLVPQVSKLKEQVAKGLYKSIRIPLTIVGASKPSELQALELKVSGRFLNFGSQAASWEQIIQFKPHEYCTVESVNTGITLDGKLTEWEQLPYTAKDSSGKSPVEFAFKVVEQDSNIYIGIQVHDPSLFLTGKRKGFTDSEGIMVCLDFNPEGESALNSGEYEGLLQGEWSIIGLLPNEHKGYISYREQLNKKGIDGMYALSSDGYQAEIRIARKAMEKYQGKDWKTLRLNVRVNDEVAKDVIVPVSWQTDWWENSTPGSGMFKRKGN